MKWPLEVYPSRAGKVCIQHRQIFGGKELTNGNADSEFSTPLVEFEFSKSLVAYALSKLFGGVLNQQILGGAAHGDGLPEQQRGGSGFMDRFAERFCARNRFTAGMTPLNLFQ